MQRTVILLSFAVAILLGVAGCLGDVPRDNPFDPSGGDGGGLVGGAVTDRAANLLADVEVRLLSGEASNGPALVAQTDAQGRFDFGSVPPGMYRLRASKVGYADTLTAVQVDRGALLERNLRLNALPAFSGVTLNTVHDSRWWPQPTELYRLEVRTEVVDPDQQPGVAKVWVEIPDLNVVDTLLQEAAAGWYSGVIQTDDLPSGDLNSLLGRVIRLKVRDRTGAVNASAPYTLVRVIEQTPTVASQSLQVAPGATIELRWDAMRLSYPFTYRVDIFRDELQVDVLVKSVLNLPRDTTQIQIVAPESRGPYFWTVSVVDQFGNRSRSKEAGLQVE